MSAKLNIKLSKKRLEEIEEEQRYVRHINRYRYIRRFCHGVVVDIGCGVGYGSHLISQNPDVARVIGVEPCKESCEFAFLEYFNHKIEFVNKKFSAELPIKPDCATIIEVLEHVADPVAIISDCYKLDVKRIIATVPAYKTTHFNEHHVKDFSQSDFMSVMAEGGYRPYDLSDRNTYPHPYEMMLGYGMGGVFQDEVYLGIFTKQRSPIITSKNDTRLA